MADLSTYIPSNPPAPGGKDYPAKILAFINALGNRADPFAQIGTIQNLSVVATVNASALTIALKTRDGSNASATNPIPFHFRNPTIATGDFSTLVLSAAHSLVISSGSTMGTINNVPFRLWLLVFNDAGTLRLAAVNCRSGTDIMALSDEAVYSATNEGGAGGADSAQVIYAGAAVASKSARVIGYLEWSAGLGAAGTWSAVPTKIQLFGAGVRLPGQEVQHVSSRTGAVATGSTVVPNDDTIPQQTGEGDQYMSRAITPTSAANVLAIDVLGQYAQSVAGTNMLTQSVYQDAVENALATSTGLAPTNGVPLALPLNFEMVAGTAAATTFKVKCGPSAAATVTFNGGTGARKFGGVMNSFIKIREIAA